MSYQRLFEISNDLISLSAGFIFRRTELFAVLQPSNKVVTILKGARGIGKSTLIQQFLLAERHKKHPVFYLSADSALLNQSLADLAYEYAKRGGEYLAIDEIHQTVDWQNQVKTIVDSFPSLKLIVSGSSLLSLSVEGSDLSRRHYMIHAKGLSFREYVNKNHDIILPTYSIETLLSDCEEICVSIVNTFKSHRLDILDIFSQYLKNGYFLSKEDFDHDSYYYASLINTINSTIDIDIPAMHHEIDRVGKNNIKKLLKHIALKCPFTPNILQLGQSLGIANSNTLKKYLLYLSESEILINIYAANKSHKDFQKPQKILLNNTNFCYAFNSQPLIGTVRETYVASVLNDLGELTAPTSGDFCLNDKWTFEVGGRSKNNRQIRQIPNSYVLADQIISTENNQIPIWLLGFLTPKRIR